MDASCAASRRCATSCGGWLSYSLQAFCTSSSLSRSTVAMPRLWKSCFIMAMACLRYSASLIVVAHPATTASAPMPAISFFFIGSLPRSALDAGAVVHAAVGAGGEEHGQRDGGIRAVGRLGKTLLAVAIIEPPLHGAQLALRHAVRRPRGIGGLHTGRSEERR